MSGWSEKRNSWFSRSCGLRDSNSERGGARRKDVTGNDLMVCGTEKYRNPNWFSYFHILSISTLLSFHSLVLGLEALKGLERHSLPFPTAFVIHTFALPRCGLCYVKWFKQCLPSPHLGPDVLRQIMEVIKLLPSPTPLYSTENEAHNHQVSPPTRLDSAEGREKKAKYKNFYCLHNFNHFIDFSPQSFCWLLLCISSRRPERRMKNLCSN